MKDYEYEMRMNELHHDMRATTDRIVQTMEKTNALWKEFAEALKKFNEAKEKQDGRQYGNKNHSPSFCSRYSQRER